MEKHLEERVSRGSELFPLEIYHNVFETGFENVSYFIKKFKEKYGVTPSKYRKG